MSMSITFPIQRGELARQAAASFEKTSQRVVDFFLGEGDFSLVKKKLPGADRWLRDHSKTLKDSDYFDLNDEIGRIFDILKDIPTDPEEFEEYKLRVFLSLNGSIFVKVLEVASEDDTFKFFDDLLTRLQNRRSRREKIIKTAPYMYNKKEKETSYILNSTLLNTIKGKLPRGAKEVEDVIGTGEAIPMKLGSVTRGGKNKKKKLFEISLFADIDDNYIFSGRPMTEFDILVIDAVLTLWKKGANPFTPEQVYIEMHAREATTSVPPKEIALIIESVEKLRRINFKPLPQDEKTIREFFKNKGISDTKINTLLGGMIFNLSDMWVETNSQWREAWVFNEDQVVFENAEVMDQIISHSRILKNPRYVDNGEISETVIKMTGKRPEIKNHLLRHILNISGSALDNDVINMENLYIWCDINLKDRREKANAAEFVLQCLDFWSHPEIRHHSGIAGYKKILVKRGRFETLKAIEIIKTQPEKLLQEAPGKSDKKKESKSKKS